MKSLISLIILLVVVGITGAGIADFENLTLDPDDSWSGSYPVGGETVVFNSGSASFGNYSGFDGTY